MGQMWSEPRSPTEDTDRPRGAEADTNGRSEPTRFERIFTDHLDTVWRTLRRLGLTDAEAEDAAQQVFLTTARRLDEIEHGRERAFVIAAATHTAANARRGARRRREDFVEHDPVDPRASPDELLEQTRAVALADRVLSDMDDTLRAVFVLFEVEGTSLTEIADILEIPRGTVASRLRRAREEFHRRASELLALGGRA